MRTRRALIALVALLSVASGATGLALKSSVGAANAAARASAPPRDLAADERLGGHTLQRHVGKTDAELAERLRREAHVSAASTYVDLATASRVVGVTLARSSRRLDGWLAREGSRPNLVLNYTQGIGAAIGRSLRRGERSSRPCDRAVVVVRWDDRRGRWYVLTSYPEARQ
ncbi:MAG: RNase A-like domain-containing protein [Vicinamibacterales bacterium]